MQAHRIRQTAGIRIHWSERTRHRIHIPCSQVVKSCCIFLLTLESICIRCRAGLFCLVAERVKDQRICYGTWFIRKCPYRKTTIVEIVGCYISFASGDQFKATGIVDGICSVRCFENLRVSWRQINRVIKSNISGLFARSVALIIVFVCLCDRLILEMISGLPWKAVNSVAASGYSIYQGTVSVYVFSWRLQFSTRNQVPYRHSS